MKYFDEFCDASLVKECAQEINKIGDKTKQYNFMEFCGGHTHAIFRYGLNQLLPDNVNMLHGPGCPVCVLPGTRIDSMIELLKINSQIILCTYADLMRVPGQQGKSFSDIKAQGANIKMIYSPLDALEMAKKNPDKEIIFFAIGFETTSPSTAMSIIQAKKLKLTNYSVFSNHVLTPPAVKHILDAPSTSLNGFIGPGHVSVVIGLDAYKPYTDKYKQPVVISGFTPLDLIQSIYMLVRQVNNKTHQIENQYTRSVLPSGNLNAQKIIKEVFSIRAEFGWRGLGNIAHSGHSINEKYSIFDSEVRFNIKFAQEKEHPHCACGTILQGLKTPLECKLYKKVCNPDNPMGACMVSSEGACAAYFTYGGN